MIAAITRAIEAGQKRGRWHAFVGSQFSTAYGPRKPYTVVEMLRDVQFFAHREISIVGTWIIKSTGGER